MAVLSTRYSYEGFEATDATVTRVGGAVDPLGDTTSRRIMTNGNSTWFRPFRAEPYAAWNDVVGSPVTVTVYCTTNTEAATYNDDIWMELEYLSSAANTLGTIVNTTKANFLAANALLPSEASGWGATNSQLNPATKSAQITLTNNNLTATLNNSGTNVGVTGLTPRTAGKYYYEITCGPNGGLNAALGYMPVTSNYAASSSGNAAGASIVLTSGDMLSNNTNPLINIGVFAPGDICSVAIDLTARLVWFRRNVGNWNNNAGYNPSTGVGGLAVLPTVAFVPLVLLGSFGTIGDTRTINFGATSFAYGSPTGYNGWATDKTTFKLVKTLSAPPPGQAGYINVRVRAAKPNAIYYIDPKVELSPTTPTPGATTSNVSSRYSYEGVETTEASVVRVGGAINPLGNQHSRKIVTSTNSQWLRPFKAMPLARWNDITGAAVTVTVCGLWGGGAPPLSDDVWLQAEYLADVASPLGKIITTTKSNMLASGTPVPADASTWGALPPTTFDAPLTSGSGSVAMSNGNLTITGLSTTTTKCSSSLFASAGKYFFEMVNTVKVTGTGDAAGIVLTYGTLSDMIAGNNCVAVLPGGATYIYINNANTGITFGAASSGNVYGFAIDLTNRLAWIRKNNGSWNGSGTADPAAGTGGLSFFAAGSFAPAISIYAASSIGQSWTANFGASAYAFAAPAGFLNWVAFYPFKLAATLSSPPPGQAGYIHARPRVARAGTTVYLDPQINLS